MSGRRIALLALIGLVPIAIALWLAGVDVFQQMGRYVVAEGVVAGEEAVASAPIDGHVVEVSTQAGQRVQAGQPLFTLRAADAGTPTVVRAPRDGTVLQVSAVVGQVVRTGDQLAALDVSSRLHAVAYLYDTSVTSVQAGQRADVTVPALGATYQGTVREILPAGSVVVTGAASTSPAGGSQGRTTYPVWVDFDYGDAPLKVAMAASVKIYR